MKKLVLISGLLLLYLANFAQETGSYKDLRDGKVYKTIKIGTLIIMSENFAFKPSSGNYWAYDNDTNNVTKYGYLYDWETAKKIIPSGWHLPTKKDWETLYKYWGDDPIKVYNIVKAGGSYGFNALLGGWRHSSGMFFDIDASANFWGATSDDNGHQVWTFNCIADGRQSHASLNSTSCNCGYSIRCVKN